jgi:hypothetical protein
MMAARIWSSSLGASQSRARRAVRPRERLGRALWMRPFLQISPALKPMWSYWPSGRNVVVWK